MADEIDGIVSATGSQLPPSARLAIVAWQGLEAEVEQLGAARSEEAISRGDGTWVSAAQWSPAVLFNGLGR